MTTSLSDPDYPAFLAALKERILRANPLMRGLQAAQYFCIV